MNDLIESAIVFFSIGLMVTVLFHHLARQYAWDYWYYNIYLKSWHWKIKRWMKLTQGRFYNFGKVVCEKCGSQERIIVHHVTYERLWHERLSDLQRICWRCHRPGSGRI